jgi:hypothetical protein
MNTISENEVHQTQFCEVTVKSVENAGKVMKWCIVSSLESFLPLPAPNVH